MAHDNDLIFCPYLATQSIVVRFDSGGPQTPAGKLGYLVFDEQFTRDQVDAFCNSLQLFGIGLSWGGPMSLVMPYDMDAIRSGRLRYPGHLVRFSIGLEGVEDLQEDLAHSLRIAFG